MLLVSPKFHRFFASICDLVLLLLFQVVLVFLEPGCVAGRNPLRAGRAYDHHHLLHVVVAQLHVGQGVLGSSERTKFILKLVSMPIGVNLDGCTPVVLSDGLGSLLCRGIALLVELFQSARLGDRTPLLLMRAQ